MTTLIFKKNKAFKDEHKYLTAKIFYGGLPFNLPIFFKNEIKEEDLKFNSIVSIKGNFKEEARPFRLSMNECEIVDLPNEDNWQTFFVNYFLSNEIDSFFINEYLDGYAISTGLEDHYVFCDLSKDKLILKKLEFGRYLPLEKPEHIRRSSSWTKAVFVNNQKWNIKFVQTSWDGENGKNYKADFNSKSKKIITEFLSIPFNIGWTELDYRLDINKYYKAAGQIILNGQKHKDVFTLLDVGEQDIPFFLVDKASQFIRTFWADSFINNFRRHIDTSEIKQIKNNR